MGPTREKRKKQKQVKILLTYNLDPYRYNIVLIGGQNEKLQFILLRFLLGLIEIFKEIFE